MRSKGTSTRLVALAIVTAVATLAGCGGDDDSDARNGKASDSSPGAREQGTADVRTAYDRTAEAETARMTMQVKAAGAGRTATLEGRGALDFDEGDSVMTVTAEGRRIEQRVIDQNLYLKAPGQKTPGGKPWIKVDLRKAGAQQNVSDGAIGDPAQSAAYAKAITDKDVTALGTEKIDDVDTTHYRVTVDLGRLPNGAALRKQLGPTLPMHLWLDDQGRIRRQQIDMTVPAQGAGQPGGSPAARQAKVSTVMEYSDFGTDVDTEAPPARQTTDMTDRLLQDAARRS
ncbi:hypothetical protein ACIQ6Y_34665 [Streptomyces sp. NPDC096205]|uniref:hypothetical protein n=1 Tax=Streptomyces sp. NPDC096205 TaxID=3366081 RepID=UPI0037FC97C9